VIRAGVVIRAGINAGVVTTANAAPVADQSHPQSAKIPIRSEPGKPNEQVQVQLDPMSGCGSCPKSGGCGVQLIPMATKPDIVDCYLQAGECLSVGERVQVQLAEPGTGWLRMVMYAYGIPTIGMIIGALVGYWSAHALYLPQFTESLSLAGFAVGLAGGLIAWRRSEKSAPMRHAVESRLKLHRVIQER